MGSGQTDLEHAKTGPVGAVPGELHPQDIPLSVLGFIHLVPQAQDRSLHDPGETPQLLPEVISEPPQAAYADPSTPTQDNIKIGHTFCEYMEGGAQTPMAKRRRDLCIYEETWRIIDTRVSLLI